MNSFFTASPSIITTELSYDLESSSFDNETYYSMKNAYFYGLWKCITLYNKQVVAEIASSATCFYTDGIFSLVNQNKRTVHVKVVGERRMHIRRKIACRNE